MGPMGPMYPPRTHTHAPAQAPALRAHAHPLPTSDLSGPSGPSPVTAENHSAFVMGPIFGPDRAHRAQGVGASETTENTNTARHIDDDDAPAVDDLTDGNGALWTTGGDA